MSGDELGDFMDDITMPYYNHRIQFLWFFIF